MRKNYLKSFVFEVTLAFHGLGVLILTQDVLVELPVNSAEILEPCFDPFFALHHLVGEIVCIDVDANRADNTEFFPHNWDGGAFEFSAPDVELVVEFLFVCQLPLFQVNQQIRRAIAQMASSDIIFEHNKRVRWISQVVQKDLDPGVWKRFPNQSDDSHVIFEILIRIVDDSFAVVLLEQAGIFFLLSRLELFTHVVLFANEDKLTRRGIVVVLQKVMHAEAKIVQIELAEVFARHAVRIEVVLLELAAELASFLIFPPEKTGGEQDERGDDRRDDINANVAAESLDHGGTVAAVCDRRNK